MLIIPIKEGESIDKALKKFKKKFEKTGTVKQLRARQAFTKPSVRRRDTVLKAAHRETMRREENQ
jgi:small subunit ribosomal protein S21